MTWMRLSAPTAMLSRWTLPLLYQCHVNSLLLEHVLVVGMFGPDSAQRMLRYRGKLSLSPGWGFAVSGPYQPGEPMKRHQDHMPDEEGVQMRDRSRDPEASRHSRSPRISRRGLLAGAGAGAAAAALGWLPGTRIAAGSAAAIPAPPNFPPGISLYQQTFVNWAQQIDIPSVWTCSPRSDADVVTLANWAYQNSYKLRPLGMGHNWSPLVLYPGENVSNVVLVNTTDYLTAVSINSSGTPVTVTAQRGLTMNSLLSTLQNAGYGFTAVPAPGALTIGGVLAIDGHGTAIQGNTETPVPGTSFGSPSNLIQSMTVVPWNGPRYPLRTFHRTDPSLPPF